MTMRPYQQDVIQQIRDHINAGRKRILVKAPTGSGKTHIFSHILTETSKKEYCSMMVRGRQLVDQASRRLFHENVNHGVMMANHWNRNENARIQICSIDTLMSRDFVPQGKLRVIDEAHLFVSDRCKEFIDTKFKDDIILSFTATPWCTESMEHLGEVVVSSISMEELFKQGYLVPPKYFAPSTPDLKGVKTLAGDWQQQQLADRMDVLTGDLPTHWKKFSEGRPTLAFAVNIKHSLSIVEQFNKAGILAAHLEGEDNFGARQKAIDDLRVGRIKILSSVGVLTTGVDIPFASCLLVARPTQSYNLYVQICGRGTRPFDGKHDFIILDHAGNTIRHGFITDEPTVCLQGYQKVDRGARITLCEKCFVHFEGSSCHLCQWSKPVVPVIDKEMEIEAGILKKLEGLPLAAEITLFVRRTNDFRRRQGYHRDYTYHQVELKYGEEVAQRLFPKKKKFQSKVPWYAR